MESDIILEIKKQEKLAEKLIREAREKAEQIILDAEREAKRISEWYENKIKDEVDKIIKNAERDARGIFGRIVSKKRKELEEKKREIDKLIPKAKNRALSIILGEGCEGST